MIYKLMLTSPSPPPAAVPPPSPFPPLPSTFPAAISGTNANWYAAGTYYADPLQAVNQMWTSLNCAWNIGTMSCTGPYYSSSYDSSAARAAVIKACQDKAASYNFDTVAVRTYRRRPSCYNYHSTECYACKGCSFYAGGLVPAGTTCAPAVANCDNAYDGANCAAVTTTCNVAGCEWCMNSTGAQARVHRVYRLRPTTSG